MSVILAIDLGQYKSVACTYRGAKVEPTYQTVRTVAAVVRDLIVARGQRGGESILRVSAFGWGVRWGSGLIGGPKRCRIPGGL